ncbi:hypothetical protein L9F63_005938, partial [Diploptera punctata]
KNYMVNLGPWEELQEDSLEWDLHLLEYFNCARLELELARLEYLNCVRLARFLIRVRIRIIELELVFRLELARLAFRLELSNYRIRVLKLHK